jgi:hypothetical protein
LLTFFGNQHSSSAGAYVELLLILHYKRARADAGDCAMLSTLLAICCDTALLQVQWQAILVVLLISHAAFIA